MAKKTKTKNLSNHHWAALVVFCLVIGTVVLNQIKKYEESELSILNVLSIPVASAQTVNATLALSPTSNSIASGQSFNVSIILNTAGTAVDGVDIYSLRFNPAILQVNDSDLNATGVQITVGSLMTNTAINTVDNTAGTIKFSQSTTGGSSFIGSGTLATISFRAIAGGTSAVTFDFTPGSTADTNVAYQGVDRLASVTNGTYIVDGSAPSVSITAPAAGATVSGTAVTLSATAIDDVGVVGVQFKIDGTNVGSEDTSSPYSVSWNSTTVSNGNHTLTAVARDAIGNSTTSASRTINVSNADTTAPTVSITAPSAGANVSGTAVTISASASDNIGVVGVQFKVDGANVGSEDTSSPYSVSWNTTSLANGSHSITAVARDAANNSTTSSAVSVNVNNADTTAPTVSITAPAANSTVSGASVTVGATASDNIGVAGVQFKVDGTNIGAEDTSAPYSVTWNTTSASNGNHILTAVARDAANNSTTSSAVSVTVNNNNLPVGNLDGVSTDGVITGWTYDPDATGSSNQVKIYADGAAGTGTLIATITANIDRPDIRSTFGITGNHGFSFPVPAAYQNGAYHSLYAYGVDIGDTTQQAQLTGSAQNFVTKKFTINTEARSCANLAVTLGILNLSKVSLNSYNFTSDVACGGAITLQMPTQSVYFKFIASPFLTRLVTVDLSNATTINAPQLFTGDINQDNIINSVDYSNLNINWFTSNTGADLNQDGLVNAIDYSFMNKHWLVTGEQ